MVTAHSGQYAYGHYFHYPSSGIRLRESIDLVFTTNHSEPCPQVNGSSPSLGTILVLMELTDNSELFFIGGFH